MFELVHNKINSNYFIFNIKLKFPEINEQTNTKLLLRFKNKYNIIIKKWIQNILDQYSLLYNTILIISNLNYDTIRVFISLMPLTYSNMDNKNVIYLSDMINYESISKLNIYQLIKLFYLDKLNLLIDLEFDIIKPHLDTDSSSSDDNNTFDFIDYDYFNKKDINNTQNIKQQELNYIHNRYNVIQIIGISGVTKNTFINEINKLSILEQGNFYFNSLHNIYNNDIYIKIKENNKHIWVNYNDNLDNIKNLL
jgi:hypothetical protein